MQGQDVVTSDDQKLGTIIDERDGCLILETGHVFKAKHAIPRDFVHDHGGKLVTTVTKELVANSPKVDLDDWDCQEIKLHYGLDGPFDVDPDPDGLHNAEVEGARHGIEPDPARRLGTLGGENDPSVEKPAVFDRMATAADPTGVTANLDHRNRTGGGDGDAA
jgi:hypothetical protein